MAHGIGNVGGEHEIRLGIGHHGRVATHGDFQKNYIRKYFPAIFENGKKVNSSTVIRWQNG